MNLLQVITIEQMLTALQIGATLLGFGGVAFSLGRLYGRIDEIAKSQQEVKQSLFGGDDQRGIFLRRAEAELMLKNATDLRVALDRRLDEFQDRLGALEAQRGR